MYQVLTGDVRAMLATLLPEKHFHCAVTSPPYWGLRDYGVDGQLGLEKSPDEYVAAMVEVFRGVWRVLRDDGTLWLNIGDSYAQAGGCGLQGTTSQRKGRSNVESQQKRESSRPPAGLKPKNLCMIPWRLALALQADGWYLRSVIVWHKRSPMPESVTDRPTSAWEPIFLMSKSERYYYDGVAVRQESAQPERAGKVEASFSVGDSSSTLRCDSGREVLRTSTANLRNVWTLSSEPFKQSVETVQWRRVQAGAASDGTTCIVSPDSKDGGGLFDLVATVLSGEPQGLLSPCNADIPYLSLTPRPGYEPIQSLRAWRFAGRSLDCWLRECLPTAISHSNGSHRTDLFVATSLACTPSAERTSRIARTLESHGFSSRCLDMHASNTWPDVMDVRSLEGTICRTADKSLGSCAVLYRESREMQSHFAVFPTEIPHRAIAAGTSERGCCPACGAGWERVTEKRDTGEKQKPGSGWDTGEGAHGAFHRNGRETQPSDKPVMADVTTGWRPTCKCGRADVVPCRVLEPFAGAGTTLMEATRMGRDSVGIELNPKYVEIIHKRIGNDCPLLAEMKPPFTPQPMLIGEKQ